jgi:tetratricopeptide (TPR) repeat protein
MGESAAGRGARYKAFISYSHKDAAAARQLHRRLETYRIPRRLVGSEGLHGPVPARLTPIFRDREEFPAAGDLSETVRAALAASDNLIVLCSPDAAASLWVGREIAVFRELHPGRPVYAAIVAGEPHQAFHAELTGGGRIEPLAADLRGQGDGRRLGVLKLAAGLAGVGLDALVQRDAQRRIRRVMAVTAAALAAVLVMAVLTTTALTARAEAERQRAEAEGLVEFMLTDLRQGLKGVGRLDLMAQVNSRALHYYGEQGDLSGLPEESLARRVRVLHAIGEDEIVRGNVRAAMTAYREAAGTSGELLERAPKNLDRMFDHSRSEFGIGRVYELRREWREAQRHYGRFASAADQLIASEPGNPDYMKKVAAASIDLGNLQLSGAKDYPRAQAYYERGIGWYRKALGARPRDKATILDLANAYGWLADSFFMRSLWQQSLDARIQQHNLIARVSRAEPKEMSYAFRLAVAERAISRSFFKAGKADDARAHLFQAHGSARRLTARDPRNAEWLLFRAFVACDLLFSGLGYPVGIRAADLRRDVHQIREALRAQSDPRAEDLSRCAGAAEPS